MDKIDRSDLDGKKHLIFDFDKTLFTLHLPWNEYLEQTYAILKDFNQEFFMEHNNVTESNYDLINRFTREFGKEPRDRALAYACIFEKEALTGITEHLALTDFIRSEHENFKFYIWSSNCVSTITPILQEHNLHEYFQRIIGRDTVLYTKPETEGFELITKELNTVKPAEFLMLGDSTSDRNAAEAAGIEFLLIAH